MPTEEKVECAEKDYSIKAALISNPRLELECVTEFRHHSDLTSTHESTMERKCAIRQSTTTVGCSKVRSKSDSTGSYSEVICRCTDDEYCNDDTWPTTEMGRLPFTVPTAVLPPTGSDLWGKGRSCHECDGAVDVRTGNASGCFFQDKLTSPTVVRCSLASDRVHTIMKHVPANQYFVHCVAEFDGRNSTEKLVVRRYCDVRVAPVTDSCELKGSRKTCRCNGNHCNHGVWSNQTGLVALPASVVIPVGPFEVIVPVKPVANISDLKPTKLEKLACYKCQSPPNETDLINGDCFNPEYSPKYNCSDDPKFVVFFKEFPAFVPMCETEMKTTAKRPRKQISTRYSDPGLKSTSPPDGSRTGHPPGK